MHETVINKLRKLLSLLNLKCVSAVLGWRLDMSIGPPMSSPVQSIGPEGVGHWTLCNTKSAHNHVTTGQSNYKILYYKIQIN